MPTFIAATDFTQQVSALSEGLGRSVAYAGMQACHAQTLKGRRRPD